MSYRMEPPTPKIDSDLAGEIQLAYESATDAYAEIENLAKDPAGCDLEIERRDVLSALETYANAIEEAASEYGVRL